MFPQEFWLRYKTSSRKLSSDIFLLSGWQFLFSMVPVLGLSTPRELIPREFTSAPDSRHPAPRGFGRPTKPMRIYYFLRKIDFVFRVYVFAGVPVLKLHLLRELTPRYSTSAPALSRLVFRRDSGFRANHLRGG